MQRTAGAASQLLGNNCVHTAYPCPHNTQIRVFPWGFLIPDQNNQRSVSGVRECCEKQSPVVFSRRRSGIFNPKAGWFHAPSPGSLRAMSRKPDSFISSVYILTERHRGKINCPLQQKTTRCENTGDKHETRASMKGHAVLMSEVAESPLCTPICDAEDRRSMRSFQRFASDCMLLMHCVNRILRLRMVRGPGRRNLDHVGGQRRPAGFF